MCSQSQPFWFEGGLLLSQEGVGGPALIKVVSHASAHTAGSELGPLTATPELSFGALGLPGLHIVQH